MWIFRARLESHNIIKSSEKGGLLYLSDHHSHSKTTNKTKQKKTLSTIPYSLAYIIQSSLNASIDICDPYNIVCVFHDKSAIKKTLINQIFTRFYILFHTKKGYLFKLKFIFKPKIKKIHSLKFLFLHQK